MTTLWTLVLATNEYSLYFLVISIRTNMPVVNIRRK